MARRLLDPRGVTLIELLVVFVVVGLLVVIAVPSYLQLRERGDDVAAKANIRVALPAIAAYRTENEGYTNMTLAALDPYANEPLRIAIVGAPSGSSYCIRNTDPADVTYYKQGPSGVISTTPCTGP